jgi:hypothetical protein
MLLYATRERTLMASINIEDLQREGDLADFDCSFCMASTCDCYDLVGDPDGV